MANARTGVLVHRDYAPEIVAEMYVNVLAIIDTPNHYAHIEIPLDDQNTVAVDGVIDNPQVAISVGRHLRQVKLTATRSGIRIVSMDLAGSGTFLDISTP